MQNKSCTFKSVVARYKLCAKKATFYDQISKKSAFIFLQIHSIYFRKMYNGFNGLLMYQHE